MLVNFLYLIEYKIYWYLLFLFIFLNNYLYINTGLTLDKPYFRKVKQAEFLVPFFLLFRCWSIPIIYYA